MSEKVVVSRKYDEHQITHNVVVEYDHLRIEMNLTAFLIALASEVDGIPLMMTQAQLRDKLLARASVVIADMKHSTIHNTPEFDAD